MQRKFQCISDPGHGWLKVPLTVLAELRMLDAITRSSYIRKGYAYLEEDCDLSAFVETYRSETGVSPTLTELCSSNKYSKVRGYESYSSVEAAETVLKQMLNDTLRGKRVSEKQAKTIRYLAQLLPEGHSHLLMAFMKQEGRLECVHVGENV